MSTQPQRLERAISRFKEAVSSRYVMLINVGVVLIVSAGMFSGCQTSAVIAILVIWFGLAIALYQHWRVHRFRDEMLRSGDELRQTMRIYERMVEQATDLIYILTPNSSIVLLNKPSAELFNSLIMSGNGPDYTSLPADVNSYIGKRLDKLLAPADSRFIKQKISRVVAGDIDLFYNHNININGTRRNFNTKLFPIRNSKNEVYLILGITRDTTEEDLIDQKLYQTEKLASIGTLAAGVAHEINNPLAVILGFSDLLSERLNPESQEYHDLKVIEENANVAKNVVQKLLGFARSDEGLGETVNIKDSIGNVIDVMSSLLKSEDIELITDIPDNLPPAYINFRELQQVIFNLINNAVAAMREDKQLTIKAWSDNDMLKLYVRDNGKGIPDKIKPHIFDPFYTTKEVGKGTGLGLSLCYGTITKYNGEITFDSLSAEDDPYVPTGTTFTITLPIDKREEK